MYSFIEYTDRLIGHVIPKSKPGVGKVFELQATIVLKLKGGGGGSGAYRSDELR